MTESTYNEQRDGERLRKQQDLVRALMCDGNWRTLEEISLMTGAPPASASARLRQLRKEGFEVQREYVRRGLWKYRAERREWVVNFPVGKPIDIQPL